MLVRMWRKGNSCTLLVRLWIERASMENSVEAPQKIKNRTTIWSSKSTSGNISKGNENTNSKRYLHPHVHSSTIYNSQHMEATQMFINRWMDKDVVYTHTIEYYSLIKKNEIMPFAATGMDLEIIILSEVSQTEKYKYHIISLIYGIWKKRYKWTYL